MRSMTRRLVALGLAPNSYTYVRVAIDGKGLIQNLD